MVDSEKFWDKTAAKYAQRPVSDTESYEKTLAATKEHLTPDTSVLELGCGTGTTALLLSGHARHITASDISANMIEIGTKKAREQGVTNVDFVKATPFDAAIDKEDPYDVVLAFNCLYLLDNLPGALRRMHALLKPGGLFISKSVCLSEMNPLFRFIIPVMRFLGLAPKVNFMTIEALEKIITEAGFEITESRNIPPAKPVRYIVARKP